MPMRPKPPWELADCCEVAVVVVAEPVDSLVAAVVVEVTFVVVVAVEALVVVEFEIAFVNYRRIKEVIEIVEM